MGASVGIGGLIIGMALLVVFAMANQAISQQIYAGLDRIDEADQPTPTVRIDDAELWEGAVVNVTITNGGSGYSAGGTIEASTGTGGFSATYTIDGSGTITSVVITSHGNYSSPPTLVVNGVPAPSVSATLTASLGNVIHANLTNTGSVTVHHEEMWLFVDGQNATMFASAYSSSISSTLWFSGETLWLQWIDADIVGNQRLTLSAGSTTTGHILG